MAVQINQVMGEIDARIKGADSIDLGCWAMVLREVADQMDTARKSAGYPEPLYTGSHGNAIADRAVRHSSFKPV